MSKTFLKGVYVFLAIFAIVFFFLYCNLFVQNKEQLKTIDATVVSIDYAKINYNPRGTDSLTVDMTISYEENEEVIKTSFTDTVDNTDTQEMLVTLKEGDEVILYQNIFGLAFDDGYNNIYIGLVFSAFIFISMLIMFFVK